MSYNLVSIKEINSKRILKNFDCGIPALNEFLNKYALKNDILEIGKTFVVLDNDIIAGYFTLATAQLAFNEIPADYKTKLPKYPVPALRIARLAVDSKFQKKGIGKWLLAQAFIKIITVSEITGLKFIIVDAKESSKSFYEHYGFIRLYDKELCYFIPIETIKAALAGSPNV